MKKKLSSALDNISVGTRRFNERSTEEKALQTVWLLWAGLCTNSSPVEFGSRADKKRPKETFI